MAQRFGLAANDFRPWVLLCALTRECFRRGKIVIYFGWVGNTQRFSSRMVKRFIDQYRKPHQRIRIRQNN